MCNGECVLRFVGNKEMNDDDDDGGGGDVSECPDNITLYHNASSYSTPSPLYNSLLWFNSSTGVSFVCTFDTIYAAVTMYKWFVNGVDVNRNSKYLDYFFVDGDYEVMCAAWYDVPNCPPCNRTTAVPITIYSTNSSASIRDNMPIIVTHWATSLFDLT